MITSPPQSMNMETFDLEQLFSQAPVAICIVSGPDYKVELVNERMLEFLGRTKEIIGKPLGNSLTEIKQQGLLNILERVQQTGQSVYLSNFPAVIIINGKRQPRYFDLVFKPYFLVPTDKTPNAIFCVAHNVTEQVLGLQSLEEEKQRTALALEVGELGIITTDWIANVVRADKRTAEIFELEDDYTVDGYINRIHPDDRKLRDKAILEGQADGSFEFEARLILESGMRWIRCKGMVQKNPDGQIKGSFAVVQDITTQKEFTLSLHKRVEERTAELEATTTLLLQANRELSEANQRLEEFTRAASHDLKEPVRKMQIFSSRLGEILQNRLTGEENLMLQRLQRAAERMSLLVDDLLAYSQLGQASMKKETIDLNQKIRNILEDIEVLIKEKSAIIETENLPTIEGYRIQLQQLFQNLLTNALKYTKPSVPARVKINSRMLMGNEVAIPLPAASQQKLFHLVEVSDNGIGFHQQEAERIFHAFTRLHGNKEYTGAGIGLSIAKKVMDVHGGYIYAEGEPGIGARFCLLFPVDGK